MVGLTDGQRGRLTAGQVDGYTNRRTEKCFFIDVFVRKMSHFVILTNRTVVFTSRMRMVEREPGCSSSKAHISSLQKSCHEQYLFLWGERGLVIIQHVQSSIFESTDKGGYRGGQGGTRPPPPVSLGPKKFSI